MANKILGHILLVDDEKLLLDVLRDFLTDEGYAVLVASHAAAALQLLATEKVDVCFVDMQLADMGGNDLIRRAQALRPAVKFIIHTGAPDYVLPEELGHLGIGAADIFIKPVVDMAVFLQAIDRLMRQKQRTLTQDEN